MRDKPLDLERLKELVGEPAAPAGEDEFVHEIAPARSPTSVEKLAAAAVAAIEADVGPRRKYSSAVRPPALEVNRKRTSYYLLALVTLVAAIVGYRTLHRPPPVPSDPIALVAVLSAAAAASAGPAEWSATRGVSDSLSERGRAMRSGAAGGVRRARRATTTAQRPTPSPLLADQPTASRRPRSPAAATRPLAGRPSKLAPLARAADGGRRLVGRRAWRRRACRVLLK